MKKQNTVFRLMRYIGKSSLPFIGMFVSALLGNAAILIAPRLIGEAIDLIAPPGSNAPFILPLVKILAVIGILYLIGSLLGWLTAWFANLTANNTVKKLRIDLFNKLGRLPLKYFDTHSHGDIISRFSNDLDAIAEGLNQGIVQLVSGVITVVLILVFMFTMNPAVAWVAVLVTPLCFLVGFFITKYGKKRFREQSVTLGELNGYAEEIISGHQTVQAFGYQPTADARFHEVNERLYRCGYRAQFASALVNPTTRFVNNITYVLVGVFGIMAVLRGTLTAGGVASFLTYTAQFAKPFNEITAITMQVQAAMASARRVFAVMDESEQQSEPSDVVALKHVQGAVEFDHVAFGYRPQNPLIRDFSLSVRPGMVVAIVGPTGAGKTTLINLLMRFYELDGGSISVDGNLITQVTRDSLRRAFGMVLQETWLFAGTIRDNIAYGKPEASDEEIEQAARAAHAHGFIRRLPAGYQTMITEDGGNLSHGQKQLLTIARAMLLNPPMLILDEATSSVDILTEVRIQKAFRRMMEGKTTFVIAHRLSTIRDADLILVLNHGDVAEMGTHDELLRKNGFYARLYQSQFVPDN